jgi:tRNA-dihydrouridine synthase A
MNSNNKLNRTFAVAPMMDWTDKHCRFFHRILSKNALLYTEMITTGALIHGDTAKFLQYNLEEQPLAIQLGGSDIKELAICSKIAAKHGFSEVNLNVGCPSDRVQRGKIGACLMAEPQHVAQLVKAMKNAVDIPVTVKHRIGITGRSTYNELVEFVGLLHEAGCDAFIVHAREAILTGMSPKLNRQVPPLKYDWVYNIKKEFQSANIIINGGIDNTDAIKQHLQHVDGVMMGRAAYKNPYILAEVEEQLFNNNAISRADVINKMIPYILSEIKNGVKIKYITKHMLGLLKGMPKGRLFRIQLDRLQTSKYDDVASVIKAIQQLANDYCHL